MRIFCILIIMLNCLYASEALKIKANANVTTLSLFNDKLYIGTDASEVEIYDLKNNKFDEPIILPKIKTYFDDKALAKIFNIDKFDDEFLVLSEGDFGKKFLTIFNNDSNKTHILQNQSIKKALFLDKDNVVLASLSNEIYFLNLQTDKIYFSHKFSTSALNDMEITSNKKHIVLGCESGKVYLFDVQKKEILKELDMHKDNIYDVAISQNDTIISGSADKKAGIYENGEIKELPAKFLVYAVGISDDGKFLAYMGDEDSDVRIFNASDFSEVAKIATNQGILNSIIFYNNLLITSSYEKNIYFWRYK